MEGPKTQITVDERFWKIHVLYCFPKMKIEFADYWLFSQSVDSFFLVWNTKKTSFQNAICCFLFFIQSIITSGEYSSAADTKTDDFYLFIFEYSLLNLGSNQTINLLALYWHVCAHRVIYCVETSAVLLEVHFSLPIDVSVSLHHYRECGPGILSCCSIQAE